ncbi:hypothetical protein GCU60_03165 [Blastococcus saxobsidens]|uniref:Uncharacterized protein n=1 Tax=Blastococcus saxobsidens TaxID=138336 RepID=A0A6L9VY92_9ACTN|nr:hypothetical protein [Blastococcus saxobsidens]NEK84766.1 hypothetical protein [Blastococcus saxobsidens]
MRKSRVLLAGVAVAAAGLTTSAFTASNNFATVDNNVAGYGEMTATGVSVSNIAYTPSATDSGRLQTVAFTVGQAVPSPAMSARMTLYTGTTPITDGANTCTYAPDGAAHIVTCTMTAAQLPLISLIDKTSLTVTSN